MSETSSVEMADLHQKVDQARVELALAQARIDKLESQLQRMDALVRADQLTNMLNRRGLDEAFEREFARVMRHGSALCVALLDLDNFKCINDNFGHAAGDAVLCTSRKSSTPRCAARMCWRASAAKNS